MAIAHDANSDSSGVDGTAISSLTWAHTCTGANRLIFVAVGTYYFEDDHVTGITYDGVALTQSWMGFNSGGFSSQGWYKAGPSTGANNIVVTYDTTVDYGMGGAVSFTGVHQSVSVGTSAVDENAAEGGEHNVEVSSAVGELVIDGIFTDDSSITVGSGQTERVNWVLAADVSLGMSTEPGAATVEMEWTTVSGDGAIGAVAIKPAAAGGNAPTGVIYGPLHGPFSGPI